MTWLTLLVVCDRMRTHRSRRADRAPGRCRAGGGLLGGKDSTGRFQRTRSVVVQDGADAAVLGEQRIAAEPEQVEVERLVRLVLAVALDFDGDRHRRLAGE